MPARVQYTFTFTNADPDEQVTFNTDEVYASATGARVGQRMELDADRSVSVWSDVATLTATAIDGQGLPLPVTATRSSPTVTTAAGTAPTNSLYSGALRTVSAAVVFGSSTVDLDTLAVGEVVVRAWAEVTTVFNAGTTNVLVLGDGTTANKYLAAADVTEGTVGVYPTGGVGPFKAETAAGTLRATFTQTGTAATTGAARVYALVMAPA